MTKFILKAAQLISHMIQLTCRICTLSHCDWCDFLRMLFSPLATVFYSIYYIRVVHWPVATQVFLWREMSSEIRVRRGLS